MNGFCAVLPAAGLSSRMGTFKPLMDLGGTSVLARSVRTFLEADVERVLVVTGHRADEVAAEAERAGQGRVETVHNQDFEQGMFTSVRTGVAALGQKAGPFFVLPADIPLVRPETVRLLAEAFQKRAPLLACPAFLGQRGHPPLLHPDLRAAILDHDGRGGLRGLLETVEAGHPKRVAEIAMADSGVLTDLDRPEDHAAAFASLDRGYPTVEECRALWAIHATLDPVQAHCRVVAEAAGRMVRALNQRRSEPLSEPLAASAALVHDLCKGRPKHALAGAEALERHGFPDAAAIVAAHPDLAVAPGAPITEREIVFLADKYVQGAKLVPLEARYAAKLDKYGADPEARQAIQARLARAVAVRDRIETETGQRLADVLGVEE